MLANFDIIYEIFLKMYTPRKTLIVKISKKKNTINSSHFVASSKSPTKMLLLDLVSWAKLSITSLILSEVARIAALLLIIALANGVYLARDTGFATAISKHLMIFFRIFLLSFHKPPSNPGTDKNDMNYLSRNTLIW